MSTQNNNKSHRQRLRNKFLKSGLEGFHDYKIIELLLTIGTPRKDCKQPAKNALKKIWFPESRTGNRFQRIERSNSIHRCICS